MPTNGELAREYSRAIENGATGEAFARFFTHDVDIKGNADRVAPHDLAKRNRNNQSCHDRHRFRSGVRCKWLLRFAALTSGWPPIRSKSCPGANGTSTCRAPHGQQRNTWPYNENSSAPSHRGV